MKPDSMPEPAATQGHPPWHALEPAQVLNRLDSDVHKGLDPALAARRLARTGPNLLSEVGGTKWYRVLASQFVDVLIAILLVAAALSWWMGETTDTLTILVIVVFNGILGFVQEWRAEQAIAALRRMLEPTCRVVRAGVEQTLAARDLVPGDLVILETGDRVPADLRLVQGLNLKADESALTGESASVFKRTESTPAETPLAERASMAWMGTVITNGHGRGVVVATGMTSEFGRIAELTQTVAKEPTPLQRKLAVLGRQLGILAMLVSVAVALAGWLGGKGWQEMFMTAVSLAVAVVPEGLPAVVTITLALGVKAMVRRRALLRRLEAAESLGAASVICTDKTGTLTRNQMTVQRLWAPGGEVQLTGLGYQPKGQFLRGGNPLDPAADPEVSAALATGLICNHASLHQDDKGWQALGEPTEAALVAAAGKAGLDQGSRPEAVGELTFDSERKRMSLIAREASGFTAHVKGAPEAILERCTRILAGGAERELTPEHREAVTQAYQAMAGQGLRTLALARRTLPPDFSPDQAPDPDQVESELTLLGVAGIVDPPRAEAAKAVRLAASAGIKVVMITGDAPATALAVAHAVGLKVDRALTGADLAAMDDEQLQKVLDEQRVLFARTAPEDKLRIVSAFQSLGLVAAMTGDGVNDAPALKRADIGIAMGLRGTDVAKGVADMVLTDDNFASIVGAVQEGRRQYDNIQKFVRYLLSSNLGEVVAIFINIILGGPLIFLPVQILWMNLVTDGLTAVALGLEPAEKGVMERPPRRTNQPILDREGAIMIALLGGYIGLASLGLFHFYLRYGGPEGLLTAQTVAFTGIILLEKINVFNFRALRTPSGVNGYFSNPWIWLAWCMSVGLQVAAVYVPFLQQALRTTALGWRDWAIMIGVALPVFLFCEAWKRLRWRREQAAKAALPEESQEAAA